MTLSTFLVARARGLECTVAQGGGVGQQSGARRGHLDDQRLVFCGHCGVMFTLSQSVTRDSASASRVVLWLGRRSFRAARRRHRATPARAVPTTPTTSGRIGRVAPSAWAIRVPQKLPDQESVCLGGSAPATAVVTLVAAAGSCPDAPDPDGRCLQAGPSAAAETSTGVRCALCGRAGRWVRHESLRLHRRSRPRVCVQLEHLRVLPRAAADPLPAPCLATGALL